MCYRRWWIFSSNKHHIWSHLPSTIIKLFEHFSTETSCFFVCEGWYKIVHQLINYYLFGKIFLSSVQKTLVDLFFKQILNIFPITCNYLKFVPESFNRDSLFFTRYFVCVCAGGWYENSHRLMNCKLYPQIFMSSVQQMLVDVSSNKLHIWSQLPGINLTLS